VGEADRRDAAFLLEVDLDQLPPVAAVPESGKGEPTRRVDLRVAPAAAVLGVVVRVAHHDAQLAADAQVDRRLGVSQSCAACHQRRRTSSLVHASNTAWAGPWNVRSMRSVVLSVTSRALGGVELRALSTRPAGSTSSGTPRCERSSRIGPDV
jgi:hypothetical protein